MPRQVIADCGSSIADWIVDCGVPDWRIDGVTDWRIGGLAIGDWRLAIDGAESTIDDQQSQSAIPNEQ